METNKKLVVILGPTSSGKTGLSIKLAKKFNGEVVSADSRQVYKGMDIGSGKVTRREMAGIPHYLLDVANPKIRFAVTQYQKLALKAIKKIRNKNKLPFLVGGTGFYIQSIVDEIIIPKVKPDWKLRKKLEKLTTVQLFKKLEKLDPKRAGCIDRHNPRRLIRALEIILKTGAAVPVLSCAKRPQLDILQIGIKKPNEELRALIHKRLLERLKKDAMIKEVEKLKKNLPWKRLEEFGLEYRFAAQYLQNKITYQEMINLLQKATEHFAKRQMTWFKRDGRIHWIRDPKQAENLIKKFLFS